LRGKVGGGGRILAIFANLANDVVNCPRELVGASSFARFQFAGASVDRLPAQMLALPSKQPMPVLLALLRIALLSSLHDLF
jgi:hypothetical protein